MPGEQAFVALMWIVVCFAFVGLCAFSHAMLETSLSIRAERSKKIRDENRMTIPGKSK